MYIRSAAIDNFLYGSHLRGWLIDQPERDMQRATRTALVIGITGSIGREVAGALLRRGWQVRALHRDPSAAKISGTLPDSVGWIRGDAMRLSDVMEAAH